MANQYTTKFENMEEPAVYYDRIKSIESTMEDNIHDLIWQYGKEVNGDYEISLWNKKWASYCKIRDNNNNLVVLRKAKILCPDKCQVRGHLFFQTEKSETISFINLNHQEFNVYSHIYRIIDDMLDEEKC